MSYTSPTATAHMTFLSDKSSSECNDVEFAHMQSRPTTPINQPTKPASTNAPERPSRNEFREGNLSNNTLFERPKLTIAIPKPNHTCEGCIHEQPNQMAHVGRGGCLEDFPSIPRWTEQFSKEQEERGCPCYYEGCPGTCGTLWCGCIDVCRGRCGLDHRDGRY
jgi:hypothetical protein